MTKIDNQEKFFEILSNIHAITQSTSYKETAPFTKLNAGDDIAYCLNPTNFRLAEYVQTSQEELSGKPIFEIINVPGENQVPAP